MKKNTSLTSILCSTSPTAPVLLRQTIFIRLDREIAKQARIRLVSFFSTSIVSLVSMFYILSSVYQQLSHSGAYNYMSLVFSDTSTLSMYWGEFLLSLIESIPLLGITMLLSLSIVFLWTSARALRVVRPALFLNA